MDPNTGKMYRFKDAAERLGFLKKTKKKLVPITEEQYKKFKPLSKRKRKALMAGMSCPCASGKSFKKCCAKKYK